MGLPSDAVRRVRRQPTSRILMWIGLVFVLYTLLPRLRPGRHPGSGYHPIVFTEADAPTIPECSKVPRAELARLQSSSSMQLTSYTAGEPIHEGQEITKVLSICVIATIPQTYPEVGHFKDVPIPGKGPDTIHLYLNSTSVRIPIPPLRPLPNQPSAQLQLSDEAILYYAELTLTHPGTYAITAEHEYRNWRWAKQWWNDYASNSLHFPTGHIEPLLNSSAKSDIDKIMEVNAITTEGKKLNPIPIPASNIHPQTITVNFGTHADAPTTPKPRCSALQSFDSGHGTWFRAESFPALPSELQDEWGYIFSPTQCDLDLFTDADTISCLKDKHIAIYGDSNARRLSRAILSGGRWCHDPSARCQSEDWGEDVLKLNDFFGTLVEETEKPEHNGQFELGDKKPFTFGSGSTLAFNFLQSLAMAPQDWMGVFYDPEDFEYKKEEGKMTPFRPEMIRQGAKPRHPPEQQRPDLVVVAVGAWDEAFDETFGEFERTVDVFRDSLLEAYPDQTETKIAIRLSQGMCCRSNFSEDLRRFSGTRIQHFGDVMRGAFKITTSDSPNLDINDQEREISSPSNDQPARDPQATGSNSGTALAGSGMDGRVIVLDASGMAGRPEVVNDYGIVGSNHQRAAHSRLEAQILLNRVCERDAGGRGVWRGG